MAVYSQFFPVYVYDRDLRGPDRETRIYAVRTSWLNDLNFLLLLSTCQYTFSPIRSVSNLAEQLFEFGNIARIFHSILDIPT